MRMALVILFAIVALGAAGIWALGAFGPAITASVSPETKSEPLVREPETVTAAAEPQQQAELESRTPAADPAPPPPAPGEPATTTDAIPAEPTPAEAARNEAERLGDAAKQAADAVEREARSAAEDLKSLRSARSGGAADTLSTTTKETPTPQAAPAQPPADDGAVATPAVAAAAGAAAVTSLESQYKARRVTYNRPPKTLVLDRPLDISLVINATDDKDAGTDALQGFPGTVVDRDVDLSDFVSAELAGTDFDIQLQTTSARQKLSAKIPNQWRWRVRPTKTGPHVLTLTIYGYASGSLDAEPLDSYRDEITVEVKDFDRVVNWAKSVQPVFAVLAALAGALSAVFAFLRFREERKRNKPTA